MSGPKVSSSDKLAAMRRRYTDSVARDAGFYLFDCFMLRLESPIEQLFAGELFARRWADIPGDPAWHERVGRVAAATCPEDQYPKGRAACYVPAPSTAYTACEEMYLFSQVPIHVGARRMRLDFALATEWHDHSGDDAPITRWINVECDGHDFHERTKEQAASDRARDRALTAKGWRVIRFTGSELYARPDACVDDLLKIVASTSPHGLAE